jgi:hypothetical protein
MPQLGEWWTILAMVMATKLGFPVAEVEVVRCVALLRFLRCPADAFETARMAGGDAQAFFAAMAPVTLGRGRETGLPKRRAGGPVILASRLTWWWPLVWWRLAPFCLCAARRIIMGTR